MLTGDLIKLEVTTGSPKYFGYRIQFKETHVETDDDTCTNYPINNHENYASCIEAEMRDKLIPDLGCMVPWISVKDQCNGHIKRLPHHEHILHWLLAMVQDAWGGSEYESKQCPLPCTLVSAQAKFLHSIVAGTNYSYFGIQFAQQARIDRIFILIALKYTVLIRGIRYKIFYLRYLLSNGKSNRSIFPC